MNHIATGRALSPRGELLPSHHGSQQRRWRWRWSRWRWLRGNSPSRQGARTETSVPRISSTMVAAWRNFSWTEAGWYRVFAIRRIYGRKGDIGGRPRAPHHPWARARCGCLGACLRLSLGLLFRHGKNRNVGFCPVQFREYFLCRISETKNSRK